MRPFNHEKLILSCGNSPTDIRNHLFTHIHHTHNDADTVDSDAAMNPTVVADLKESGFYDYLLSKRKTYKEIRTEAGYELHGLSGIEKLKKILAVNGIYASRTVVMDINVIHRDKIDSYPYGDDEDGTLNIVLEPSSYYKFRDATLKEKIATIIDKMQEIYQNHGFEMTVNSSPVISGSDSVDLNVFDNIIIHNFTFALKRIF